MADAVRYAAAERAGLPQPPPAVTSRDQAEAILGGPIPAAQLPWWEAALIFLVDRATFEGRGGTP